jgi:hypothetical protein
LVVSAGAAFSYSREHVLPRIAFIILLASGAFVNFLGVIFNFLLGFAYIGEKMGLYALAGVGGPRTLEIALFDPSFSPILAHLKMLLNPYVDYIHHPDTYYFLSSRFDLYLPWAYGWTLVVPFVVAISMLTGFILLRVTTDY